MLLLLLKYEKRPEHDVSKRSSALKRLAKKSSLFIDVFVLRPFQKDLRWGTCDEVPDTIFFKFSCRPSDRRWMSGWYFLLRLAFYATYAASNTFIDQIIAQEIMCIMALLVTAIIRPYRRRIHNWIECFHLTLLAIILSMTIYQYYLTTNGDHLSSGAFYVQIVLGCVPLTFILLYLPVKFVYNRTRINEENDTMFSDERELEDQEQSRHEPAMITKCLGFLETIFNKKPAGCRFQHRDNESTALDETEQQHRNEDQINNSQQRSSSFAIGHFVTELSRGQKGSGMRLLRKLTRRSKDDNSGNAYTLMTEIT